METADIRINHIETRSVMTKSNTPLGGYSVNPYVGCPHACRYCYASFMKRFTGHTEPWGTFIDVKHWPAIKDAKKYAGQKIVIGTVTDGYNPLEETYENTRRLLEELKDSPELPIYCSKSDEFKDTYMVEGPRVERMLGYTNLEDEKGFLFFQNFMNVNLAFFDFSIYLEVVNIQKIVLAK